ncbi:LlaJI restriction endonuclease [Oceanobacillus limi]|uniref:LlaJI restriction endonuclease n=1 Tax=Oceanobacillus limi TaxID=930131 RepID=A0A1H9XZZ8_9BACI|nr:LlaJI family restriction endonuclease [Oceanobacillus limi]SES62038.1 LlaJI restriction endonuclease [Oceanobacillus limi]
MIAYLKEWQAYTESELMTILRLDIEQLAEFKRRMREMKILEQNEDSTYSFKFVGLLEYNNQFVFFIPKYITGIPDLYNQRQLIDLFLAYSKRENLLSSEKETLGNMEEESEFELFSVIDFLLTDYLENGLYTNEKTETIINGEGEIGWNKTIEEQDAFLIQETPIYFDLFTNESLNDETYIIRQIHQYVLSQCSSYMEQLVNIGLFDYPSVDFDIEIDELGSVDYLLYVIENEMQQQFYDHKLKVLRGLFYFLSKENGIEAEDSVQLFGTRTFHVVWEKVCSFVLGNQYDQYKERIPKPQWTGFVTEEMAETDTLIPDLIVDQPKIQSFFVMDVKYYNTSFSTSGKSVFHNPGIGDVSKQYLYEKALRSVLTLQGYNWYNIFLMPTEDEEGIFGKVELPFMSEFHPIYLQRLDAAKVFDYYIKSEIYPDDFYEGIQVVLRDKNG